MAAVAECLLSCADAAPDGGRCCRHMQLVSLKALGYCVLLSAPALKTKQLLEHSRTALRVLMAMPLSMRTCSLACPVGHLPLKGRSLGGHQPLELDLKAYMQHMSVHKPLWVSLTPSEQLTRQHRRCCLQPRSASTMHAA
jgi:hypothetical protein